MQCVIRHYGWTVEAAIPGTGGGATIHATAQVVVDDMKGLPDGTDDSTDEETGFTEDNCRNFDCNIVKLECGR